MELAQSIASDDEVIRLRTKYWIVRRSFNALILQASCSSLHGLALCD